MKYDITLNLGDIELKKLIAFTDSPLTLAINLFHSIIIMRKYLYIKYE